MTATITRPGLDGTLEFCTRHHQGERIIHRGPARLVDAGQGMFLFVCLETGIEMWLHPDEVVEFTTRSGAS